MKEKHSQEQVQTVSVCKKPSILNKIKNFFVILGVISLAIVALPVFIKRVPLSIPNLRKPVERVIPSTFPKEKVDKEIYQSMCKAYYKAEDYASIRLDNWIDSVMTKADNDFLPWYFGFINMKTREIKGLGYDIGHWFSDIVPTSQEAFLKELEQSLNSRLIQPETTQVVFENILRDTTRVYNEALSSDLSKIQTKYKVPTPEWEKYLSDLSHVVRNTGTSMTVLPVKGVVAGAGAAGLIVGNAGVQCAKAIGNGVGKILSKTTTKTVAKSGAKAAAKTGSKVGAKTLGKFAGPIITVAIIVWDVVDYKMTESKDKLVLRQNIYDYLINIKSTLLYDEEFGICSELNEIQTILVSKL